jgi:hypothetical protein
MPDCILASQRTVPSLVTFLHLADAHLTSAGVPFERDDHKLDIAGIEQGRANLLSS